MNITEQLNLPFPYEAYRCNYERQVYVGVNWIVERLNLQLDCNWTHEVLEITERLEDHSVEVFGKLSIYDPDREEWISRYQFGNDTMTLKKHTQELTPQARMDCKKSAISDSLKKTAALFGAGLDVYKNLIKVIEPNNSLYLPLANKFPKLIDTATLHQYGIPVLPDHYKEYYAQESLEGIFMEDVLQLKSQNPAPATQHNTRRATTQQNQSTSNRKATTQQNQSTPNQQVRGTNNQQSAASENSGSNSPAPFRILVNDAPVFNKDKSSLFNAIMEDRSEVVVFAHKNLFASVQSINKGDVINLTGWLKAGKLTIMHTKGFTVEAKPAV